MSGSFKKYKLEEDTYDTYLNIDDILENKFRNSVNPLRYVDEDNFGWDFYEYITGHEND